MAYKIAVVSDDGVNIDLSFGAAYTFDIYEVEGREYHLAEKREYVLPQGAAPEPIDGAGNAAGAQGVEGQGGCGTGNGCGGISSGAGSGCGSSASSGCGTGGGCGSAGGTFPKVQLISDCRCVICKKIGFNIQKQLEKLAITGFDVDCTVEEALTKITAYLDKIDHHQSLRGIQNQEA